MAAGDVKRLPSKGDAKELAFTGDAIGLEAMTDVSG